LQEMELEDGAIERFDGFVLDKSRTIGLCDELHDDNLREYHRLVFRNPLLVWFLSRGDIRHFLYRPGDYTAIRDSGEEQGYDVEKLLTERSALGILNLLPEPFRDQQATAVRAIRDIAIASYNQHNDIDLSKAILALSGKFNFKSAELTQRLEADFQQIQKLIAEERKHEAKLTLGEQPMEITKEGVRKGSTFIGANVISSVRWGILLTGN